MSYSIPDKCSKIRQGGKRSYYITCRSYWTCPNGVPKANCCKRGYRFDHKAKDCVLDTAGICNDDCPPVEKTHKSSKLPLIANAGFIRD